MLNLESQNLSPCKTGLDAPCNLLPCRDLFLRLPLPSSLGSLGNTLTYQRWYLLGILFYLLLLILHHIRVHLVGADTLYVEPVYMVSGVATTPQKSSGALTLPVDFIMFYSSTLVHKTTVSHLILYKKVGLGNEGCFWSNQREAFPAAQNYTPEAMNSIGACCHGSS